MIDLYVSKNGDNGNPGTKEQPFATIEAARDAVRSRIREGLTDALTVHIEAGEYLKKLGLTKADWGNSSPIGSYNTGDRYDNADTSAMSCELFFNDTRMKLARYPDAEYLYTVKPVREGQGREGNGPNGGCLIEKISSFAVRAHCSYMADRTWYFATI